MAVMDVCCGDAGAMDQAALTVGTNAQFHPEEPLVALLGLMHLRVAILLVVHGYAKWYRRASLFNGAVILLAA